MSIQLWFQVRTTIRFHARAGQELTLAIDAAQSKSPLDSRIEVLTADAVRKFYRAYYHPGNTVLSIVGNVDPDRVMAEVDAGVALRATFIVDPDNVIQHVSVNNLNVGRNPEEILRLLDGLQTDELCPCNRTVGGATL